MIHSMKEKMLSTESTIPRLLRPISSLNLDKKIKFNDKLLPAQIKLKKAIALLGKQSKASSTKRNLIEMW